MVTLKKYVQEQETDLKKAIDKTSKERSRFKINMTTQDKVKLDRFLTSSHRISLDSPDGEGNEQKIGYSVPTYFILRETREKKQHIFRKRSFLDRNGKDRIEYFTSILSKGYYAQNVQIKRSELVRSLVERTKYSDYEYDYSSLTEILMKKGGFFYEKLIESMISSIKQFAEYKNIRINEVVLQYLLKSCFHYKENENFGICYSTIQYMSRKLGLNRVTISNTLRKLEYMGIINYVVADRKTREIASDNIDEDNETEKKRVDKEIRIFNGELLFPALSFSMLLNYTLQFLLERDVFSGIYGVLETYGKKVKKNIAVVDDNIKELGRKNTVNVYDHFRERYSRFFVDPSPGKFFEYSRVFAANHFFDYKKSKYLNYTHSEIDLDFDDMIESGYLISIWLRDMTASIVGKPCSFRVFVEELKKYPEKKKRFAECISKYLSDKTPMLMLYEDEDGLELNITKLFERMMISYKQGIVEQFKFNTKNRTINTFTAFKDPEFRRVFKKEKCTMSIDGLLKKINNIMNSMDLKRETVQQYTFNLFEVVKQIFNKIDKDEDTTMQFFKDFYSAFVSVNKSPVVMLNNFKLFLLKYSQ